MDFACHCTIKRCGCGCGCVNQEVVDQGLRQRLCARDVELAVLGIADIANMTSDPLEAQSSP